MKKILILWIVINSFFFDTMYVFGLDNNTEITNKNNSVIIGQTTFVDENGDIKTVDVYDGTTGKTYNPYARTVSTANVVNFNCSKAGITTSYIDYYTGQEGYLSKASAADGAYLGMENGKVKFMISGVVGLVSPSLVEILPQGQYYVSNYEVNSSGKLYHYISNNVNATGNQGNRNYIGEAPSYLSKNIEYYSYDGHYFYKNYNVMINDYKNNVRTNSINPTNPYYNYFQYLPLRSKTNYTGNQLSTYLNNKANSATSKLNNTGDIFIKYQNKYGVNALLVASFAALESGWGKSKIALNANNLFGLNATDNNPEANANIYPSIDNCIYDFTANWMSQKYLNPKHTSVFRGGYFGDKGSGIFGKYSSDPYEGEKIASIASDMDANIANLDKGYYTIGIKDKSITTYTNLNIRAQSNTNSSIYYTTIKNPAYAFVIVNKSVENDFYKIQNELPNSDATYNFNNYAYASVKYISIINDGKNLDISSGWKLINGKWYYLDTNGVYHIGWLQLGNTWYYMNSSGVMQTGWLKSGNTWYYLNSSGAMVTGLQKIGNNLCYFNSSGAMQMDWKKINSKWYYFDQSGYAVKQWQKIDNIWYYFNEDFQMQTGWQKINNKWYYLCPKEMIIDGRHYYEGYMAIGWIKLGNTWYYLDSSGAMQTGWQKINNKWYYLCPKEMIIDGRHCYEGYMAIGWLKLGNTWYYLDLSGAMVTGTVTINGKKYRFNSSGAWIG